MSQFRIIRTVILFAVLFASLSIGLAVPAFAAANAPSVVAFAAPAQPAPIENSFVPAIIQVLLIVLVTQGIKSLARALGGTDENGNPKMNLGGKEAALAYVVVGVVIYVLQTYLLPALPPGAYDAVTSILGVVAVLLAGSGLFDMTSALRVK